MGPVYIFITCELALLVTAHGKKRQNYMSSNVSSALRPSQISYDMTMNLFIIYNYCVIGQCVVFLEI